jgi:hypothetical protein
MHAVIWAGRRCAREGCGAIEGVGRAVRGGDGILLFRSMIKDETGLKGTGA